MPKTVMFIDDENILVDIFCHKMEHAGLTCLYAPNGQTGIEMLNQGPPPDLIVLDIMMPGMNGFDVLKELKSNEKTAKIPVIMFSSEMNAENVKKAKELGAEGLWEKTKISPGDFAEILQSIHLPSAPTAQKA